MSSHAALISAIILRETAFSLSGWRWVSVASPSTLSRVIWLKIIVSLPSELCRPLGEEGRHALAVIRSPVQRALRVALEVELLVERVGGRRVDRQLDRGIGQ